MREAPLPGGERETKTPSPPRGEGRGEGPAPAADAYVPTEEWTWRLLNRGFTVEEAAAIRGLEHAAILPPALGVARQGRPVPLRAFLAPAVIDRWPAWPRQYGDAAPPPESGALAGLWPLYLACCPPS